MKASMYVRRKNKVKERDNHREVKKTKEYMTSIDRTSGRIKALI